MARFIRRAFPSANTVVLDGGVVVDPGDDPAAALAMDPPEWVLTTHWHSDHAGAVHALQEGGARVAVPAGEAAQLAEWGPDAGRLWWLRQHMERYHPDRGLSAGDVVEAGEARWTVVALPGHTAAQIGFYDPEAGVLIAGDALHEADVGWLDLDADPAALDQAEATLDTIARLRPRLLLPGHGPAVEDIDAALVRGRRRLQGFRAAPDRIVFHAAKRILTHALMTEDGVPEAALTPMLLDCPWFHDHARRLGLAPEAYGEALLAEMLRSGAAMWKGGDLVAAGPYRGRGARRAMTHETGGTPQSSPPFR